MRLVAMISQMPKPLVLLSEACIWADMSQIQRKTAILQLQEQGLCQREVAEALATNRGHIASFCSWHGITGWRTVGAQPGNKNAKVDGQGRNTIMRLAQKMVRESGKPLNICERCQVPNPFSNYPIHHKDSNRRNNTLENFEVLCQSCHSLEHIKDRGRSKDGKII